MKVKLLLNNPVLFLLCFFLGVGPIKPSLASTLLFQAADLSIENSVDNQTPNAGDQVTVTLTVSNLGPDLATGVEASNQIASGFTYLSDNSGGSFNANTGIWDIGDLDPNDSKSIEIRLRINGSGNYQNTAEVSAAETDSNPANNSQTITLQPVPVVDLEVSKVVNDNSPEVGEEVIFTVRIKNQGPSLASDVALLDQLPNGFDFVQAEASQGTYNENTGIWEVGNLSSGLTATLTITATVLEPTPDREYENTAEIMAVNESDQNSSNDSASQGVSPQSSPSFSITKTANETTFSNPGEEITYEITLTNTGNVSIFAVVVTDPKASSGPDFVSSDGNNDDILDVGETWTFEATYAVTQEDIDAGSFTNEVMASGTPVAGNLDLAKATAKVDAMIDASWSISKSSSISEFDEVGEEIDYEIILENTGNVSIRNVVVNDPTATSGPTLVSGDDGNGVLDVGETWIYEATHVVTQEDLDAGEFTNTVTADGDLTFGTIDSVSDSETDDADPAPSWTISKSANVAEYENLGQEIVYTIEVENTGNVSVSDVQVDDPKATSGPTFISGDDNSDDKLNPGETWTFEAKYTITQADLDNGSFTNEATVSGQPAGGSLESVSDEVTVNAVQNQGWTLTKVTNPDPTSYDQAGERLTYEIRVENTGNVSISDVLVSDPNVTSGPTFQSGDQNSNNILEPGEVWIYTASYQITQADIDAGQFFNEATASGNAPGGDLDDAIDSVTVPAVQEPEWTISKSVDQDGYSSTSDVLTYEIILSNTGNVSISNVIVSDPLATSGPTLVSKSINEDDILDVGETWTYSAEHQITQEDLDAGEFTNTVTASGDPAGGELEDVESSASLKGTRNGQLTTEKTVAESGYDQAGQELNYTIVVTNTGNQTLTDIVIDDPKAGINETIDVLAPGESFTLELTYTVTQEDVDRGSLENTVRVNGSNPAGTNIPSIDSETINAAQTPKMEISKVVDKSEFDTVGEELTYTIVVSNTGNITINNLVVDDPLIPGGAQYVSGDLDEDEIFDVGEVWTFTAVYEVTQEDIDAGGITNTVTASGDSAAGDLADETDEATSTAIQNPAWEMEKTATNDPKQYTQAGEVITYEIKVTNTGNVSIKDVDVFDPGATTPPTYASGDSDEDGILDVGETWIYTATYTVKQSDIDNGSFSNTATANGNSLGGTLPEIQDSETVPAVQNPDWELTKTADRDSFEQVGEEITYTLVVENTGNVSITDVEVTDPKTSAPEFVSGDTNANGVLDPGEQWIYETTYTVTQEDINAGSFDNTATATGNPPAGLDLDPAEGSELVDANQITEINVDKSVDQVSYDEDGVVLTFTIVVKNTGNVDLTDVSVSDDIIGLNETGLDLAPGEELTYTGTLTVSQEDVDNGSVVNTAIVEGTGPDGTTTTDSDDAVSTADQKPSINVDKSLAELGFAEEGDVLTYTIVVTNTGNVTLTDVVITDPLTETTEEIDSLAPGESVTIEVEYVVTQEDIDRGTVTNDVSVTSTDPNDQEIDDQTSVTIDGAITDDLTITKTADLGGFVQAGEVITYTIVVTNSGNTVIDDINVLDEKTGLDETIDSLEPGESVSFTTEYTVTQADVDRGFVDNTATVEGLDPNEEVVESSVDELVNGAKNPSLAVDKSVSPSGPIEEGQVLTYTIVVTNDGNQTITDIVIDDPLDPSNPTNIGDLAPGESFTYTFEYTVTADDESNGFVNNTATATGKDPEDNDIGDGDSSNIGSGPASRVEIEKNVLEFGYVEKDQVLNYTVTVTNTGSADLTDVNVVDDKVGFEETLTLAAGESQTFNLTYTVTQNDLNVGFIENTATVTAKGPSNEDVSDSDTERINGTQTAQLVMDKSVAEGGYTFEDDILTYTITVTNSGNVTIFDIQLTDPLTGYDENIGDLDPGESFTITQTYQVTQNDVDVSFVTNTASATGDDFYDNLVQASAEESVSAALNPRVEFTKTVAQSTYATPGDPLDYTITVTNTGNLTLFNLVVSDPRIDLESDPFDLAPGESEQFTGIYITDQDDLDLGEVPNTATLAGEDFNGNPINRSASRVVRATRNPEITVNKTADVSNFDQPGDEIQYQITFANTGNITITNPVLEDPQVNDLTYVDGDDGDGILQVGETWNYTASYTVTQEDIDNGEFKNTAGGTGTPSNGGPISGEGSVTVDAIQNPGWTITKTNTNTPNTYSQVGETLTYEIVLDNVGNVSIRNVAVTDAKATTGPTLISGDTDEDDELDVDEVWIYEATHVVTQADIDAGSFENTAKAKGRPAGGSLPEISDAEVVNAIQNPSWVLEKTSITTPNTYDSPGDILNYTITIENNGNVSITNVDIQDPFVQDGPTYRSGDADTDGVLDVGEKWSYAAKYTVDQDDIDNESFANTVTATGTAAGGNLVPQEDTEIVPAAVNPELEVVKKVDKSGFVETGEVLTYTIVVTNTGNMTLENVVVVDDRVSLNDPIGELAPGESRTYTETYTVTQDDLNQGSISNTVKAVGFTKNEQEIEGEDTEIINGAQNPKLEVTKSVDQTGYLNPDEELTYDITVTNTGNVTIFNLVVEDNKLGFSQNVGMLQPGESVEFLDLTYTVTQADVDEGQILNLANATGNDLNENEIKASALERITGVQNPAISSSKSSPQSTYSFVGEVIDYVITINNDGNVSFFDVEIVDPKAEITSENPVPVIDPFSSYEATAQHIVTQADLDAGSYQNQAQANGLLKTGDPISTTTNRVTLNAVQNPSISIIKESSTADYDEVGDVIDYTFTIENTGNVTLSEITVSDPKVLITSPNPVATLSPGYSITLTAEHVVTQEDLDAGEYRNTASVAARSPKNVTVNDLSNEVIVPAVQEPSLKLTKSTATESYDEQGDVISYEILVENTGNVTLSNIEVTDPKAVITDGNPIASLAPGESATITAEHVVILQDINDGFYTNLATAIGKDTNDQDVPATSNEVTVPAIQTASISLEKKAIAPTYSEVDEIVSYEITVTNTGNVTVTDILITDELTGTSDQNVGDLDPGESTSITVDYDGVTQEDLDSGEIPNTASAVGLDPNDEQVIAEGDELVEAVQSGAIEILKVADRQQYESVDEVINYTITITNIGNVTLTDITATDPLSGLDVQIASLAPEESETYSTSITVTQADLDNGAILNTATTSGFTPTLEEVTDTDDVTVTALRNGSIELIKTPEPKFYEAPDTEIVYTLTVTNDGNLTLNEVVVNDPLTGFETTIPTLAPGQTELFTTNYTTTQADVDAGFVDNVATARGLTTQDEEVNDTAEARIVSLQSPGISVTKAASPKFFNLLGEEIAYEIVVTNTGNVTLTNVQVNDPKTGFTNTIPTLAPGQALTFSTSYTIQQLDVDARRFTNEVVATGTAPSGTQVTDRDDAVVFIQGDPAIELEKTANPLIFDEAGEEITYTLTATNIGSQSLSNVVISDPLTGTTSSGVSLAPGESTTLVLTYLVTQEDLNSGSVFNNATVVALAPDNSRVADSDDAVVLGRRAGAITIDKVADRAIYAQVGEEITYTLTITNTGNVTLTDVTFSDPLTGELDEAVIPSLEPGESEEVTTTYLITQEDIDRGFLVNEASTSATTPADNIVSDRDDARLLARRQASVAIQKTPQTRFFDQINTTITYDLEVTNTGNVTLTNVEVNDPLTGFSQTIAELVPRQVIDLTTDYVTIQADLDRGFIRNVASVEGITPAGRTVSDSDDALVLSQRSGAIALDKISTTASYDQVGDQIAYTLTVTNIGNVTLTDVEVVDPLTRFDQNIATLAPGESQSFTTTYQVNQADLDRGFVENTAETSGRTPANRIVQDQDAEEVPAIQNGAIAVEKAADVSTFDAVGDVITYTITVTNTGNVTLKPVTVKDPLTNLSQTFSSLAVGESKTITTEYSVQQRDLDLGFVPNTVTAEGRTPKGDLVLDRDQVRVNGLQNAQISLEKEADRDTFAEVGEVINYTLTVTNTGNQTLIRVNVTDPLTGFGTQVPQLLPGQSEEFTATYTVTQQDLDAGSILNTATVTGRTPSNTQVSDTDNARVIAVQTPAIELTKVADVETYSEVGDQITYTLEATNTGNVTLENVTVVDPLTGLNRNVGTLEPGESTSGTTRYVITQDDLDNGLVDNIARVRGTGPRNQLVTDQAEEEVLAIQSPEISLEKTANISSYDAAGDLVTYTLTATNTGNVTLEDVTIVDPLTATTEVLGDLAPGESVTISTEYSIMQSDVNRGSVTNVATASGTAPDQSVVEDEDSVTITADQTPAIELTKTTPQVTYSEAGEVINYTIQVENTGNVTLRQAEVTDPLTGFMRTIPVLVPGQIVRLQTSYSVTQADIDNGSVVNTATVVAIDPNDQEVRDFGLVKSDAIQRVSLQVSKRATPLIFSEAGQVITYLISVTNTGNVTLNSVETEDLDVQPNLSESEATLSPGEILTYTASYTITQEDMNNGSFTNTASATAVGANGVEVEDSDEATVIGAQVAKIEITKTANTRIFDEQGEIITYTLQVENTGNVTLTDVEVNDDDTGFNQFVGTLQPGEEAEFTTTYTITLDDVNRETFKNTATVAGFDPNEDVVTDSDDARVFIRGAAAIELIKTPSPRIFDQAGEVITYEFKVVNIGNQTLTDISLTDLKLGISNEDLGTLEPGQSTTFTATYTATQEDLDAGFISNTAEVSSLDPDEKVITDDDFALVVGVRNAAIELVKTPVQRTYDAAGDVIDYTLTVTNIGNVTLDDVIVDDPLTEYTSPAISLAPGESETFTTSYTVLQANMDAGFVRNTATVSSLDPRDRVVSDQDNALVIGRRSSAVDIQKTPQLRTYDADGVAISYSLVVTNTGNVTLENLLVTDTLTNYTETILILEPGESEELETTYTTTQADVDRGFILNSASVEATTPADRVISSSDLALVFARRDGEIELIKETSTSDYDEVGDEIEYTLTVRNVGNVTLSEVQVNDPLTNTAVILPTDLAPGEEEIISTSYTITQEDLDRGFVLNEATTEAKTPANRLVEDQDEVEVPAIQRGEIAIEKEADLDSYSAVGEVITYTITVTNTGNVTLAPVNVKDPLTGLNETVPSLAPAASVSFTTTHTITQKDLDSGAVENTAAATGTTPAGQTVDDEASVTVPAEQNPGISIVKTADRETYSQAGEVINYSLTITNTGNVTLAPASLLDPLTGFDDSVEELAPGQVITLNPSYTVTQEDVDNGQIVNTASVTGVAPDLSEVTDEDEVAITAVQTPSIALVKEADVSSVDQAGDVINYTITVTNTGNITLVDGVVTDPLTDLDSPLADLAPGESVVINTTYEVLQSDIDAGLITNTAEVNALGKEGTPVDDDDTVEVEVIQLGLINVTKTADVATYDAAGDVITYTIVVTNTGNVTLTEVVVTDPLTDLDEEIASLAPGQSQTFTETYTILQSDVDAGERENTASASGKDPNDEIIEDDDSVILTALQLGSIELKKTARPRIFNEAGEVITYTLTVTNTGNLTLSDLTLTDELTEFESSFETLAPGQSQVFTTTYTITQEDVDAGFVLNDAAVQGSTPDDEVLTDEDDVRVFANGTPAIEIEKTARPLVFIRAGQVINYTLEVTNVGTLTLENVTVKDPLTGLDQNIGTLSPESSKVIQTSYTVLQSDVDRGSVLNEARASGISPQDEIVTDSDEAIVRAIRAGRISIDKSPSPRLYRNAGEEVSYTIVIENTGNVTLTNVQLTDPLTDLVIDIPSLSPGQNRRYTETYAVTQADVDRGFVLNTATVSAITPAERELEEQDRAIVFAVRAGDVSITKEAGVSTYDEVGDIIPYTLLVTNTGNVTLTDVTVTDPLIDFEQVISTLAVGESEEITFNYEITQGDLDAGQVPNTATVVATTPADREVDDSDSAVVTAVQNPDITVVKTAEPGSYDEVGEVITYTITVTNTGNVTLKEVKVIDAQTGLDETLTSLTPNASEPFTTTHTITQADLDEGSYVNVVLANGKSPQDVFVEDEDEETVVAEQRPEVQIVKEADVAVYDAVGDVITYTLTVTNTGNVTLDRVTVTDPLTLTDRNLGTLAPGETRSGTVSYTITQQDLDAGSVPNTATVVGTDPNEEQVSDEDSIEVFADQRGAISLTKVADKSTYLQAGEEITYSLEVTNTGNVTLTDVVVTDPLTELTQNVGTLAPGESSTLSTVYTVKQSDLDRGQVSNTASAVGSTPSEDEVEDTATEVVAGLQAAAIGVEKTASPRIFDQPGNQITYTLTVTNIGNVTLRNVTVRDPLTGLERDLGTFAPGISRVITEVYVVTQEDLERRFIRNVATATGLSPSDELVDAEDDARVFARGEPAIEIIKTSLPKLYREVGDVITYTLEVTNIGNLTLENVTVVDELTETNENVGTLAPLESITLTESYTVTQEDLDRGFILNTASASGATNLNRVVEDEDRAIAVALRAGNVQIVKTADREVYEEVGEEITYTLVVTNTGNVTLTEVVVVDELVDLEQTIGTLNPGESQTLTTSYSVTQADLNEGFITNTAEVTALTPADRPLIDSDDALVTAVRKPAILLEKSADQEAFESVGEEITYSLLITNAGNVTLTDVTVTDPLTSLDINIGTLEPGQSQLVSASYLTTQADMNRGFILNEASVVGTTPANTEVSDTDDARVEAVQTGSLELNKVADVNSYDMAGDVITYTITATNTGNVTLTNVMITDPLTGLDVNIGTLEPGESESVTTDYTVTQADVDRGFVANAATGTGETPDGGNVSGGGEVTVPGTQTGGLELEKTANVDSFDSAGEVITYTITATNTGNVTLTDVTITDPLTGLDVNIGTLEPGESESVTTDYTVTQADVDRGFVANAATGTGETPDGGGVSGGGEVTVPGTQTGGLELEKTANVDSFDSAGEVITYTITATNTGNVTLNNVTITDPLTGLDVNIGTLEPGESESVTTDYTVTQADVDRGFVANAATGTGETPDGGGVSGGGEVTVPGTQTGGLELEKTANVDSFDSAGDVITYTITATNTGNVTLTNVTITDPLTGLDVNIGTLEPGESESVTTDYTVTQADVDRGFVVNAATGTGETPDGGNVSGGGEVTVPAVQAPSISLVKSANKSSISEIGEEITYTLTVTNTGNVPLSDVAIDDERLSFSENVGDLGVGESREFTLTYKVTAADILSQEPIVNQAQAQGNFGELTVSAEDEAVVSILCEDKTILSGIIFETGTDLPLEGVPVIILGQDSGTSSITITDSEGRFILRGLPEGVYRIRVLDQNLNKVGRLFASSGNSAEVSLSTCDYVLLQFPYEREESGGGGGGGGGGGAPTVDRTISGFVWYDLNGDGITNEWYDANNDGLVSENPIVPGATIDLTSWEWFDFNGDGRYDGPENLGELNRAGFGNPNGQNLYIEGPNGYTNRETVSLLGYWTHVLPIGVPFGEFTITLEPDDEFSSNGFGLASSGLVKVLPEAEARLTQTNEVFCEFTTPKVLTQIFSPGQPNDFNYGLRCLDGSPNEIIANDDLFGEFFLSFGGVLGNILENDLLAGQRPNPDEVEITITDFGDLLGVSVDANGDLVLLPGLNPVGTYTLTYTLGEVAFPDNTDDAIIVITIINDQVDLGVEKTSFEAEIFEGDEFIYEVVLSNLGDTDAREVTLVDDLPQNVTYLSSEVTSNTSGAEVSLAVTGSRLTWTIPFFESDATITFNILVKAGDPGLITNTAEVDSPADDINELNDVDDDVNEILPFRIPNVITPGKIDGDNDTFEILGIGKFVSNDIVIFNRYGDHVLETENYQNDWDAPGQVSGTYFYIFTGLDKDGKVHEFRGWIQVIKE
ncbi:DUF7507 domain-containing protein [Algoriphagus namhaensis]